MFNEKRRIGEFNTHREYRRPVKKKKTNKIKRIKFMQIGDGTHTAMTNKVRNITVNKKKRKL